jgi:hypothetical protein
VTAGQYLDIPSTAQAVFDGVIAHFAASEVALPDLRYIAPGATRDIAWDCESFLMTCSGIPLGSAPGLTAGAIGRQTGNPSSSGGVRYAVFGIQIVRCVPSLEDPNADKLTEAALGLFIDAGMLSQALEELCGRNGLLRQYGAATAGDIELLGPSGGYSATEGHLAVTAMGLRAG